MHPALAFTLHRMYDVSGIRFASDGYPDYTRSITWRCEPNTSPAFREQEVKVERHSIAISAIPATRIYGARVSWGL